MNDFVENCLQILPATLDDYHKLAHYHYRTEPIRPATQIYKINAIDRVHDQFPDPIAVIVYRQPIPDIRARTNATKGYFKYRRTQKEMLKLVNKKIQYLARLIVDPRFRKLGLATWLLTDTLERQTVPIVETLTPIDFTNKIFQKAGFKLYHTQAPTWYRKFTDALQAIGFEDWNHLLPLTLQNRIDHLEGDQAKWFESQISQFIYHFNPHKKSKPGIDRTDYVLRKLPYPEAYLIWLNPRVPRYDENPAKLPVTPTIVSTMR